MQFRVWLLLLVILLRSCQGIQRLAKSPQNLPEPARGMSNFNTPVQNRKQFVAHILDHRSPINRRIPQPDADTVRIALVNMNNFHDLQDADNNVEKVRVELEMLKPAIIAFQEVPRKDESHRKVFDRMLSKMGMIHQHYYAHPKLVSGLLIASRAELSNRREHKLAGLGQVVAATIKLGQVKFSIILANISYHDGIRRAMARNLGQWISQNIIEHHIQPKFILLGNVDLANIRDFNELVVNHESQIADAFNILGWESPRFTSYSNTPRDWILMSKSLGALLTGAYMHLTLSSSSMLLAADLEIFGAVEKLKMFKASRASFWFIIACLATIIVSSIVGIFFWIRSKLYDD